MSSYDETETTSPFSIMRQPSRPVVSETVESEGDDSKLVSPFKVINRGHDSLDADDNVLFADFTPVVVPSNTPSEEIDSLLPKESSAPELAQSYPSIVHSVPQASESSVRSHVVKEVTPPKGSATGGQGLSSLPKSG